MAHTDELHAVLKRLRLSGLLETMDLRIGQLVDDNLDAQEFLYRLFNDEAERRNGRQLQRRIRAAGFESLKTIADFDFGFNPELPKQEIIEVATGAFITKNENVLIVGPAGVGKSHIAQAIGVRACQAGKKVLYVSARSLFTTLRAGRGDGTYEKRLAAYAKADLIIIDDLGLHPLNQDEPADLYEIIRRRYERGATIITSNRDIPEWFSLFGDSLLASAAMDRLLHHCHTLTLEGRSYRTTSRPSTAQT